MQKQLKYLIMTILIGIIGINISTMVSYGASEQFYYDIPTSEQNNRESDTNTEIGKLIKSDAVKTSDGLLQRLMRTFKLEGTEYTGDQKAFYYIKKLINYALGFVSFIAFILLLYAFYMMLIGDWEKGRSKVKSTLKGIAIAIIIMALARLIVSSLFWIYEKQAFLP